MYSYLYHPSRRNQCHPDAYNNKAEYLIDVYKFYFESDRQKKYDESAKSFGMLGTPQSMYWQARSFYRIDRREEFDRVKREFEKKYQTNIM